MKVIWAEEAARRLTQIEEFIARDRPEAAARFVSHLVEKGNSLARWPYRGRMLPEISVPGLRELVVRGYRIVYRLGEDRVEILTVFDGHRGLPPTTTTPVAAGRPK
jgi:plasmid stabilization system protein ParE